MPTGIMMSDKKILDDIARVAGSAIGTVAGIKGEIDGFIRQCMESYLLKMNLVSREEFDLVKDMLIKARMEQDKLLERIVALEKNLSPTDISEEYNG
jgi:BMFP domain-containing protein YqiC